MANTGILVAAIRAQESARADALFSDPFAAKLAGEAGRAMLAGAVAAAGDQSTWQIVVSGETDDDGVFTTAQLPGEYYVIEVVHPDFLDDSIWVEVSGDTSSTVSMTRRVPGTITITVLDEQSEQPVAGAAVIVRDVTFSIVASGETDSNGLLVTQQLPGNHYYIAISHPDYLIQTTDVSVIGDASSTVFMTPRVPGVLAVTVLDEQTQEPVVGVAVVVRDGNDYSRIVASGETGEDVAATTSICHTRITSLILTGYRSRVT